MFLPFCLYCHIVWFWSNLVCYNLKHELKFMVPSTILNRYNNSNQNIPTDMKCPSLFLHIHSKSSSLFKTQLKSTFHCSLTVSCGLILPQPGWGSHLDHRCRFQLLLPLLSPPFNLLVTSPACGPSWAPLPPGTQGRRWTMESGPLWSQPSTASDPAAH